MWHYVSHMWSWLSDRDCQLNCFHQHLTKIFQKLKSIWTVCMQLKETMATVSLKSTCYSNASATVFLKPWWNSLKVYEDTQSFPYLLSNICQWFQIPTIHFFIQFLALFWHFFQWRVFLALCSFVMDSSVNVNNEITSLHHLPVTAIPFLLCHNWVQRYTAKHPL